MSDFLGFDLQSIMLQKRTAKLTSYKIYKNILQETRTLNYLLSPTICRKHQTTQVTFHFILVCTHVDYLYTCFYFIIFCVT